MGFSRKKLNFLSVFDLAEEFIYLRVAMCVRQVFNTDKCCSRLNSCLKQFQACMMHCNSVGISIGCIRSYLSHSNQFVSSTAFRIWRVSCHPPPAQRLSFKKGSFHMFDFSNATLHDCEPMSRC